MIYLARTPHYNMFWVRCSVQYTTKYMYLWYCSIVWCGTGWLGARESFVYVPSTYFLSPHVFIYLIHMSPLMSFRAHS